MIDPDKDPIYKRLLENHEIQVIAHNVRWKLHPDYQLRRLVRYVIDMRPTHQFNSTYCVLMYYRQIYDVDDKYRYKILSSNRAKELRNKYEAIRPNYVYIPNRNSL